MKTRSFILGAALALSCIGTWAQSGGGGVASQTKGIDPALLEKAKAGDSDAEHRVAIDYANLGDLHESHRWHVIAAQEATSVP